MHAHTIITYSFGKLGRFLVGREEGRSGYMVLCRDIFDRLAPDTQVRITFDGVTVFAPSYGDETLGNLLVQYPDILLIDPDASYPVKKALETIEITRGITFIYG
jgi:hypothetical protein